MGRCFATSLHVDFMALSDEDLVRHVRTLASVSVLENELTQRLEAALAALDTLTSTEADVMDG